MVVFQFLPSDWPPRNDSCFFDIFRTFLYSMLFNLPLLYLQTIHWKRLIWAKSLANGILYPTCLLSYHRSSALFLSCILLTEAVPACLPDSIYFDIFSFINRYAEHFTHVSSTNTDNITSYRKTNIFGNPSKGPSAFQSVIGKYFFQQIYTLKLCRK